MSPYGLVPCLVDGDRVVFESAVINEYLEESYPEPPLMPKDPYQRAQARIWTDFVASRFNRPLGKVRRAEEPAERAQALEELKEQLAYVDKHLAQAAGGWFVGGTYGMADINFIPFIFRTDREEPGLLAGYPALSAWWERVQARESFRKTLAE